MLNKTRIIVQQYINRYYELTNLAAIGLSSNVIEARAEGLGEQLINYNPYWWESDSLGRYYEKPVLYGSPIEQFIQAINAVNELLDEEEEGMEPFEP
jgi:hypothetical protein